MLNLKIGGIIAGAVLIISFLIGLISGVHLPFLLIRPLLLSIGFFIFSMFINFILRNFLPELLDENISNDETILNPGSRINIIEGDTEDFSQEKTTDGTDGPGLINQKQPFLGAQPDDGEDGIGNISSLMGKFGLPRASAEGISTGLDQNAEEEYNNDNDLEELTEPGPMENNFSTSPAPKGNSNSMEILPDLESMVGAFIPSSGNTESDTAEASGASPHHKPKKANKNPSWSGDFNGKELAQGLRTILKKEKEG